MKLIVYSMAMASWIILSGCVHRTVTVEPAYTDPTTGEALKGTGAQKKVVEDKTIWIWQDEFRHPK